MGHSMKKILKSKAWDAQISLKHNCILYQFARALKIVDLSDDSIRASRKVSMDYYISLIIVETKGIIVAMCFKKNQIDILSLKDLSLLKSINRNIPKRFICNNSVMDKEERSIYSILYTSISPKKSIITKFDLETYEEEIVAEFPERYLFDMRYSEKEQTCLICGEHFYDEETEAGVVGEYEVFWFNDFERRKVLINLTQSSFAHVEKIGISEKQEILLFYTLDKNRIFNLNTDEEVMKLALDSEVAFSENGKYIACMEYGKTKSCVTIYSNENQKLLDEYVIEHDGYKHVRKFGFRGGDKYLVFRMDDTMYIMKIESK